MMLSVGAWSQTSLQEQINNAADGATVILTENVTLEARIDINKDLTVDLGGYTITPTATCGNGSAFNIVSGNVIIQNGTIDASFGESNNGETDAITARSGSDITLKDLNITVKSRNGACAYAFDGSKITIKSGHYENQTTEVYEWNSNIKAMVVNQANVATQLIFIEGGTFKGYDPTLGDDSQTTNENATFLSEGVALQKDASGNYTTTTAVAKIGGRNYASLTDAITAATEGQTVTLLVDHTLSAIVTITAEKNFILDLNGKTLTGKLTNNGTLVVKSSVDGGKMYRSKNGNVIGNNTEEASLTIESGIIELDGAPSTNGAITNKGTLLIKGGEIKSGKYPVYLSSGKCEITGGTLTSANGSLQVNIVNGGLKAPESITNNAVATYTSAKGYVYSITGAIEAVANGETVTLTKDVALSSNLLVNRNLTLTLNLGGHNITSPETVLLVANGTLNIEGEGLVKGNINNTQSQPAVWANGGNIIINNGTFDNGGIDGNGSSTIYAGKTSTVTINNGTFKSSATSQGDRYWVLNTEDGSSASIIVSGGEFYNFDPANNVNDGNSDGNGTNYVADGYITEMTESGSDKIYIVKEGQWVAKIAGGIDSRFRFATLDDAINAANEAGQDVTVTLLTEATATVEPAANVTIDADGKGLTLPTFNVADGTVVSYAKVINATDNSYKVTTATYNRTGATGTQWGTACLPFSFESKPEGYTLYTPSEVSAETLTVTEVEYPVAVGTPVIFFKENIGEATITSENATIKINSTPVAQSGDIHLVGTFSQQTITDGLTSIYYINGDKFHQAKASLTVPAYRAYIQNTSAGARATMLSILVDGEATAIESVTAELNTTQAIYDLNGRKLAAPQKGINIIKLANGKSVKVIK